MSMQGITFQENILLSKWGSYHIGGPARYFFEAHTEDELNAALAEARRMNLPIFFMGAGTNLLISDSGFDGLVIKIEMRTLERDGTRIRTGAGVLMSELILYAAEHGLSGLEWAGGLPGTVGGAIRGNAGCFGGEMKDSVEHVKSISVETLGLKERTLQECRFGYRMSIFKEMNGKEAVMEVTLALAPGEQLTIQHAAQEKIDYRQARHPMDVPNIGSIFKNVPLEDVPESLRDQLQGVVKQDPFPVIPAAYLISEAGMKEQTVGGAMVSPKHPNFIVNAKNASSADVEALIIAVKHAVKEKFGIVLEEEVQRI